MGLHAAKKLLLGTIILLAMSDCAMIDDMAARPSDNTTPSTAMSAPAEVVNTPDKESDAGSQRARRTQPDETSISPKALVGNSEVQLVALLGQPSSVRQEPPAMVWRYAASPYCTIDIFFYFDIASEEFRSLAYKFYWNGSKAQKDGECLAKLRRRTSPG